MAGHSELITTLDGLRRDVAQFRRVALHSHSVCSHDYGRPLWGVGGSRVSNEDEFAEAIVNSKLDMVAITDHMKCDYACRLSESAAGGGICILPGMEVSLRPSAPLNTFRLHILVIFPEKHSHEQICKILPPDMQSERDRDGKEEIGDVELSSFIANVHAHGGICIAAHIDTDRGVRKTFRQLGRDGIVFYADGEKITAKEEKGISDEFKEWLLLAGFDAIEVAKDTDKEHYRWVSDLKGTAVSIPVIMKNDAHRVEDLELEELHTHIKMTKLCFEDLKQAFLFPDTRIRFPSDVPGTPSPRILGLEIIAGDERGFFKPLRAVFSDNLTCLIGPRGSGKSTMIEALRYVFGFNRTLNQIEQAGTDLVKKIKSLQEAALSNCVIRTVYCREDGQTHILEATFDPKQDYTTRVYTVDGDDLQVHDVEASGAYPLRLFGWSEIETLGREAHRQRDLLDRLITGFFEILERRNEVRSSLAERRKEIESSVDKLMAIMRRNQGEIERYKEYKADFDRLNTPEIDSLFKEIDIAKEKQLVLGNVKANAQDWLDELTDMTDKDIQEGVKDLLSEGSKSLRSWWRDNKVGSSISARQAEVRREITKGVRILRKLIHELDSNIRIITEDLQEKEKELREKIGEEAAKQVATELRRTADERLKRVNQLRREYTEEWKLFSQLLDQWRAIVGELTGLQKEISDKRARQKEELESKLNQFSTSEMSISLRLLAGGDRSEFIDHLSNSGVLTRQAVGNYRADVLPLRISLVCTPVEMAEAILAREPSHLAKSVKIEDEEVGVEEETAERLISSLYPFSHNEEADILTVDMEKLNKVLRVAEVEWDDDEGILLNGRPVEKLSPGQRSSAMLPLIALVENIPLVIDQPEDNLDNRLVGKMLVDILAGLKEKRQIIVATHNPNIVVSGDAEQVIVLDALSDREGTCKYAGSIDKGEIVTSVIEIMEGGKEAFLSRSRRYHLVD